MAVFEFKGLNEAGKTVSGLKEADSAKTLRALLRKDGVFLTEVVGEADGRMPGPSTQAAGSARELRLRGLTGGRVTTDDIAIMTRQLATLLKAGVALVESLSILVDQIDKERFKRVVSDIKQRVNEGSSLADAMGNHRKVFGSLYINMIRAGETSGALDSVLLRLADFTSSQAQLRNKVMSTMLYPFLMTFVGGIVMVVMMTVVVPKVTKMFQDMKATLPWTTRLLIAVSDVLQNYWYILIPLVAGTVSGLVLFFQSPRGKPIWDRLILNAPLFGTLVRRLAMARFSRTLATLLSSGVPLLTALDIVNAPTDLALHIIDATMHRVVLTEGTLLLELRVVVQGE